MNTNRNVSERLYDAIHDAFGHFNRELFDSRLPPAIITLHRHRNFVGYFHADQWRERDGDAKHHEIALNPEHMGRSPAEVLSTLAHEMVHHEQHMFGKPTKSNPHNREWVGMMQDIGLEPFNAKDRGKPPTGRAVSHNIVPDGLFARSCERFLAANPDALGVFAIISEAAPKAKKRDLSKVKHTCPQCEANAWAKLGAKLICGDCDEVMPAEDIEEEDA